MQNQFFRTELLFHEEGMQRLYNSKVAVFGVGGVGGYTVEALARSGIGQIDIYDHDAFDITNLNRQLHALHSTLGENKVDVVKLRILDINPNVIVNAFKLFYMPDSSDKVDLKGYNYIVDAIDTITGKVELIVNATQNRVPIVSSMGAGNKIEASSFKVTDIYSTSICPMAKIMRHELRRRGIKKLKVVFSTEIPKQRDVPPSSTAFVPSVVGLILAGEVVKDIVYG